MGEIQYRTTGVPQAYRRRTIPQACHRRTTGVLQACRRHTAGVPQAYRHATGVPQAIQSLLSVPANESQAKRSPTSSVPKSRSPALNPSPATPRWRASQHRWPWAIGCYWKGFKPFFKGFSGMRTSRVKLHNQNPTCQTLTHLFFRVYDVGFRASFCRFAFTT